MRSLSSADKHTVQQRERFATKWAVAGIFFSFLFVLLLLYPGYNLLEQRHASEEIRYQAISRLFSQADPGSAEWLRLRDLFMKAAQAFGGTNPPSWQLGNFAADAKKAGDLQAAEHYSRLSELKSLTEKSETGADDSAFKAMSKGNYRGAADIYFGAMSHAESITTKREYFIKAIRALQAGNMPVEAFDAGERHLDGLASDRATLIFLTRAGLAAGQPLRAQRLIRKALGMETSAEANP